MANSRQAVRWTLAQHCTMRTGDKWATPEMASVQLAQIRSYSGALKKGEVIDDVWISNYPGLKSLPDGYLISKEFSVYGGVSVVEAQCHVCPANTELHSDF